MINFPHCSKQRIQDWWKQKKDTVNWKRDGATMKKNESIKADDIDIGLMTAKAILSSRKEQIIRDGKSAMQWHDD